MHLLRKVLLGTYFVSNSLHNNVQHNVLHISQCYSLKSPKHKSIYSRCGVLRSGFEATNIRTSIKFVARQLHQSQDEQTKRKEEKPAICANVRERNFLKRNFATITGRHSLRTRQKSSLPHFLQRSLFLFFEGRVSGRTSFKTASIAARTASFCSAAFTHGGFLHASRLQQRNSG